MAQAILNAIRAIGGWIEGAMKTALYWIWEQLWDLLSSFLGNLGIPNLDTLFDSPIANGINSALAAANQWVPVTFGLTLLGMYMTFWVALIPVRFILGHLPTVGGRGA